MGGPPSPPSSTPAPAAGQPPWPAYPPPGPYYPYYGPPPPRRDNTVLIIVLVVVLVVVLPVVMAAVLYVMVSGLLMGPVVGPFVSFGFVDQTGGNATIPIAYASTMIDPIGLRILLQANYSVTTPHDLPPPFGSIVITTGGHSLRVFWLDDDENGLVGTGDWFWVTGDFLPLPPATSFGFLLRSADGRQLAQATWTTS